MTDPKPVVANPDLGVVDPLRIPGAVAARRIWRGLPTLAQVFVALAALDVLVRAVGLFGTGLYLFLDNPLSWFTAFFPHDALIMLPALIVTRRPDAIETTPLIVRGAVAVALVELLNLPIRGFVAGNPLDPVVDPTVVSILSILVTAGGWFWMAQGVRGLNPVRPAESIAGLANLVGGALAIAALANFALVLFSPAPDVGNAAWTSLLQLDSAMLVVQSLAFAYLARSVVLGTADPTRPIAASYLATAALVVLSIGSLLMLAVGQGPVWVLIGWFTGPVATTAFVASFGLGLADPWGTIDAAVHTEQSVPA